MKNQMLLLVLLMAILSASAQEDVVYSLGGNAWVGSENDDDKGLPAEGLVSDVSYHFQFSYKFPTNKESSWIPFVKSVQQYVSVRALQFRSNVVGSEGYEWIESYQAFGVVYGRRYFLRPDFQGLNMGWYLGVARANTDGYNWRVDDPNPTIFAHNEKLIVPLYALELNYHYEYRFLFIEPTYSFYVNTENGDFEGFPSIIVGFQFYGK